MFSGSIVAMVTPFRGGKVDWENLAALVDFHVDSGTTGIVACGTTGESATLNHTEHLDVVKAVVKAARKRIPVIAGTGSNSTKEAVYLNQDAEKDAALRGCLITTTSIRAATHNIYRELK